ncbi:MAG: excinuclease ABC subunit UvrC [Candidatus Peregrinibacteria bacterium]|nr:excinuclease ABC subunit UvrC [Candidatus Peregrinibacteria bacterium]
MNSLKSIISHIPHSPGVYQFLNFEGEVIYVGKAIDLKKRVSSYFRKQKSIPVRLRKLVENTVDLQYTVVDSELEALILETNLIKSYRPRYNVLMKDDKNYVYVKVTVNEPFPRAYVARQLKRDGARYFGPKSSSGKVKEILKVLKKAFAYRHCDLFIDLRGKESRLSRDEKFIAEHERRCLGPCILGADRSEYDRVVEQTIAFFEGKTDAIINQIKKQMGEAVEGRDFERAAQIRDRLQAIEGLMATQRVISSDHASRDVIGLALEGGAAYATLFMFREGKLLSQENFKLNAVDFESGAELADDEVLDSFLKQYYEKAADFPSEVLLPQGIQNEEVFEVWLSSLVDRSIKLITPKRGKNRKLIDLANENALSFAKQSQVKWQAGAGQDAAAAMQGLKELLDLARLPNRIECYDISHLGGVDTVGSMVVFEKGFPKKVDYRHFKLRTVQEKIDDYKAMGEVLERRLRYLKTVPDYLRKPKKKEMMDIHRLLDLEEMDCT